MKRETLDKLSQQLDNTQGLDANQQAKLDELKQHVQAGEAHPGLLDELEQAVIAFGDDHPDLAAALRAAIAILGEGGI